MQKKKTKLISLKKLIDNTFKTKEAKTLYESEYKQYRDEKRRLVLLEFGKQLKAARVNAGFTQNMLAKELHTDIANISRIEHGRHNLTVDYIVKVAQALKRPVRIEIY